MVAEKFNREDLVIINITGEFEANNLIDTIREGIGKFAPDYDGTTKGSGDGINVMIEKSDLSTWKETCKEFDVNCEISSVKIENGHYGDGGWNGIEIVSEYTDADIIYWIEN